MSTPDKSNPFVYPEAIDPAETDRLKSIYRQNKGKRVGSRAVGISEAVESAVMESAETDRESDFDEMIEQRHEQTVELFGRIKMAVPDLADFIEAGVVNLEKLAHEYESMHNAGLEPQIVIAPHHGTRDIWERELFRRLTHDPKINPNPLKTGPGGDFDGLWISVDAANNWVDFDRQPASVLALDREDNYWDTDISWTIRIVSSASAGIEEDAASRSVRENRITIGEYLTLQGLRIQKGKPLLDQSPIATTLHGDFEFDDGVVFAVAGYDRELGYIFVDIESASYDMRYRKVAG